MFAPPIQTEKRCTRCGVVKTASQDRQKSAFSIHGKKGWQDWCKDCYAETDWKHRHPAWTEEELSEFMGRRARGETKRPYFSTVQRAKTVVNAAKENKPVTIRAGYGVSGYPEMENSMQTQTPDVLEEQNVIASEATVGNLAPATADIATVTPEAATVASDSGAITLFDWLSSPLREASIFFVSGIIMREDTDGMCHILTPSTDNPGSKVFGPGKPVPCDVAERYIKLMLGKALGDDVYGIAYR